MSDLLQFILVFWLTPISWAGLAVTLVLAAYWVIDKK